MKKVTQTVKKNIAKLAVLSFVVLQGCASSGTGTFVEEQVIDSWKLKGKMGLAYPVGNCSGGDCRKRSDQGSFDWKQLRNVYDIVISDPFGRKVLSINGNQERLQAEFPGKKPLTVAPREFLSLVATSNAQKRALSNLSPSDLQYWVTGRPNPRQPFEKSKDTFTQKGFTVSARQWRDESVGKVPSLVVVTKGDFKLRIVMREWSTVEK